MNWEREDSLISYHKVNKLQSSLSGINITCKTHNKRVDNIDQRRVVHKLSLGTVNITPIKFWLCPIGIIRCSFGKTFSLCQLLSPLRVEFSLVHCLYSILIISTSLQRWSLMSPCSWLFLKTQYDCSRNSRFCEPYASAFDGNGFRCVSTVV